jgi:cystathionine beta-lyase family protein involved in aluminum resistance
VIIIKLNNDILEQGIKDMNFATIQRAEITEKTTLRALEAMRAAGVAIHHFQSSSGYGYNDTGRDKLEEVYAAIFGTEAALARQQIISGTHAITVALFGNLIAGDELLTLGMPYDTLRRVIGINDPAPGTMIAAGIKHRVLEIDYDEPDTTAITAAIRPETKIISIQRSRGYSWRNSLSVKKIAAITAAIKVKYPEKIVFVDNCYGELVEEIEPTHYGVDLMAGSLIKNLGAGLCPCGGYVVGREDLVDNAAYRLSVPGAGREVGPSLTSNRLYFQSLFMAPQIVEEALLGAVFIASVMQGAGFKVSPLPGEERTDIIQAVHMGSAERLIAFCRGIQRYSPVDSFVQPMPAAMPGYDNEIIMAAGAFVQGSSIELSADAPLREPYNLFIQGGLSRYHTKYAVWQSLCDLAVTEE